MNNTVSNFQEQESCVSCSNKTEELQYNSQLAQQAAELLTKVKQSTPLVQCLTNTVVQQFTANILLAAHCSPAMAETPGEADLFTRITSAALINVGTLTPMQHEVMPQVAQTAHENNVPWVLDPVAVGALPVRTDLCVQLLKYKPTIIRANASEILGLSHADGGPGAVSGRGTDSTDSVESALNAARYLQEQYDSVIAISGEVDYIVGKQGVMHCANGSAMLTKVTGGGCALGAILAAYASVTDDYALAAAAGQCIYGIAAQLASCQAAYEANEAIRHLSSNSNCNNDTRESSKSQLLCPGTFAVKLLDYLSILDESTVLAQAKLW